MLVVDDEEGPRLSLQVIFGDEFQVLMAEDGPTAIDLIRHQRIDVVVLDVRMGGMSGLEVLERLRYIDPDLEAVMMTAFETTDTMRQALRMRACDYLGKPFDVSSMRTAVGKAMERRSLGGEVRINLEKLQQLQGELQEVQMEGEQARTRGEIYASIIHDINGPLSIISGHLQFINTRIAVAPRPAGQDPGLVKDRIAVVQRLEGEDLDLVKDRLKKITRQATNCIQISRRYLSFLRKVPGEPPPKVWVNQILSDLGELLRTTPATQRNEFLIHPLAEDVCVAIHGTDLVQVLVNLTHNALQCTPQHHRVDIRGQRIEHPPDLSRFVDGPEDRFINRDGFRNEAPLLSLAVEDNGPGIPPAVMPRIFEPYFTTQPRSQGIGLGLCIVHRLLKEARAGLHVHTKAGQGTVFTLYLPALSPTGDPSFLLDK